jgi:hypothetical protein
MHNERRRGQQPGHHGQVLYLRGAAGIGLGTTIKFLRGAASIGKQLSQDRPTYTKSWARIQMNPPVVQQVL